MDIVDIKEKIFEVFVEQGQRIKQGQKIATMNRSKVSDLNKETTVIVVITNSGEKLNKLSVEQEGRVTRKQKAARVDHK
ncbi:hypothetical protein CO206_11925 [Staphylococcus xylosus]|nr:hypothetical protein CO206_11925 [Staphylococcus xylosus]